MSQSDPRARFALFAEVFKALSHPKRLEIIHALRDGEHTATELAEAAGLSKTAVSQHLSVLKAQALVLCDKPHGPGAGGLLRDGPSLSGEPGRRPFGPGPQLHQGDGQ